MAKEVIEVPSPGIGNRDLNPRDGRLVAYVENPGSWRIQYCKTIQRTTRTICIFNEGPNEWDTESPVCSPLQAVVQYNSWIQINCHVIYCTNTVSVIGGPYRVDFPWSFIRDNHVWSIIFSAKAGIRAMGPVISSHLYGCMKKTTGWFLLGESSASHVCAIGIPTDL